jgi:hypothetical protein
MNTTERRVVKMGRIAFTGDDEVTVEDVAELVTEENVDFAIRVLTAEKLAKDLVAKAYEDGEADSKEWVEVVPGFEMKGSFVEKESASTVEVLKAALHAAMEVVKSRNQKLYERLHDLVNSDSISGQADEWGVDTYTTKYITHTKFRNTTPVVTQVRIEQVTEVVDDVEVTR